jgi:hypothetical protein
MTKDKKEDVERQTKAGMMSRNRKTAESEKQKSEAAADAENTPKISKEKAEERDGERPLH